MKKFYLLFLYSILCCGFVHATKDGGSIAIQIDSFKQISCNGLANGMVAVSATGGQSPYTFSISPQVGVQITNGVFTQLAPGNYTILCTDANNDTTSIFYTVSQPSKVTLQVDSIVNNACYNYNSGKVKLSGFGGVGNYSFYVLPNKGIQIKAGDFENLHAGNYVFYVSDSNGCIDSQLVTITEPNQLLFNSFSKTDNTCFGDSLGTVLTSVSGGLGFYNFTILPNLGAQIGKGDFIKLPAGNYRITVFDSVGCNVFTDFSILQPFAITPVISINNSSCNATNNGTITVTSQGGTGTKTYQLFPATGNQLSPGRFVQIDTGRYRLRIQDSLGCFVDSSIKVVQNPKPNISLLSKSNISCFGKLDGNIQIQISGGVGKKTATIFPSVGNQLNNQFYNLPKGTYSVTVTDSLGCSDSITNIIINEPTKVNLNFINTINPTCYNDSTGAITVSANGGNNVFTFGIVPNLGNKLGASTFINLPAGDYTVFVADSNNCIDTAHYLITQPNSIFFSAIKIQKVNCGGLNTGQIHLSTLNSNGKVTYSISPNLGTQTTDGFFDNLPANTYKIQAIDANGCKKDTTIVISQNNNLQLNIAQKNISCFGSNDGQIIAAAFGGLGTIIYAINPTIQLSNTNGLFNNIPPNTYTITATDSIGCSISKNVIITQPSALNLLSSSVSNLNCDRDTNGAVTLLVNGGTGVINYNIVPNKGYQLNAGQFTGLDTGNYIVYASDSNGCLISKSFVVASLNSNPARPSISSSNGTNSICNGAVLQLTTTANSSVTYKWFKNNQLLVNQNSNSILADTTASYTVQLVSNQGCSSLLSNPFVVNQKNSPAKPTISPSSVVNICNGDSVLLTASNASNYQWYVNGNIINGAVNQQYRAKVAGNYTVQVFDSACGFVSSNFVSVNVVNITAPTLLNTGASTLCLGDSTLLQVNGTGTFQWLYNGVVINGQSSNNLYVKNAGTYQVLQINSNCISPLSNSIIINTNSNSVPTIFASNNVICYGNTVILNASSANTYQWYFNGTVIANATNQTYQTNRAGTYKVLATSTNGCGSVFSNNIVLTEPTSPTVQYNGASIVCAGQPVTLISSVAQAYQWYFNGVAINNANNATYNPTVSGVYAVSDLNNGCASPLSNGVTITFDNSVPPATINASGNTTVCLGNTVLLSTPNIASSYQWYKDGVLIPTATLSSYSASSSGLYTVQLINSSGCKSDIIATNAVAVNIINASTSTPTISTTGSTTICSGNSVQLNSTTATRYQWYIDGTPIPNDTLASINANVSGVYTVKTASGNHNCFSNFSNGIQINITSFTPTITSNSNNSICSGTAAILTASAGIAYQWSYNGVVLANATQSIQASAAGTYSVTVTNSNGCTGTSNTYVLNINAVTTPSITATSAVICAGSNTTLRSAINYNTYQWYFNGTLIPNSNTNQLSVSNAGTYYLVGINSTGCASLPSNSIIISQSVAPNTPSITPLTSTFICKNATVTLSASSNGISYQWYLNGNALVNSTTSSVTVSQAGLYTVVALNADGCSSASSSAVSLAYDTASPTITSNGSLTFCAGSSVNLSTNFNGIAFQWYKNNVAENNAIANNYTVTQSGVYTVSATTTQGCTNSSLPVTINVITPTVPTLSIQGNKSTICNGDSLLLSTSTGYRNYQWFLNNSLLSSGTQQSIYIKQAGNYYVVASDNTGCNALPSNTITVNQGTNPSTPVISYTGNNVICPGSSLQLNAPNASNYIWYVNGTAITGSNTSSIQVNQPGNYAVVITNSDGCKSSISPAVSVSLSTASINIIQSGNSTICAGDSVTLIASNASSYQWLLNGQPITNATSSTYTVKSAGNYSLSYTNNIGCTFTSNVIAIAVNSLAAPTVGPSSSINICAGNSTTLSASSGYSFYQWYKDGILIVGANSSTYTTNQSGNYAVLVRNSAGCAAQSSNQAQVIVTSLPSAPVLTASNSSICNGAIITLTANAQNNSSYQWFKDGSLLNGVTLQNYQTNIAGTYSVKAVNSTGCVSTFSNSIVLNSNTYTPTITASGRTQFCAGGNVLLTSSLGQSYQWFADGVLIPNATSSSLVASTQANYTVKVTLASGCIGTSLPIQVKVITIPTPTVLAITNTVCQGKAITLNSSVTANTYQWYNNNVPILGAVSNALQVTDSGNYAVVAIDSNKCNSLTSSKYTVTLIPKPNKPVITSSSNGIICNGNAITLTSNTTSSGSNIWLSNGNIIATNSSSTLTINTSGNYALVQNVSGCLSDTSNTLAITQQSFTPSLNYIGTVQTCVGNSVNLVTNLGLSQQWYFNGVAIANANTNSYRASSAGSYYAVVTNNNGCTASTNTIQLNVNAIQTPAIVSVSNKNTFCNSDSLALISNLSLSQYQWFFNGTAISGANAATYIATQTGAYTLSGVSINSGCTTNVSLPFNAIKLAAVQIPVINTTSNTTLCNGTTAIINSQANASYASYQWYKDAALIAQATNNQYTVSTSGVYTLQVKDTFGCSSTSSNAIPFNFINFTPQITANGATTFCVGNSLVLTSTTGSSYQWYFNGTAISGANANTFTAVKTGNYAVDVTNVNGCISRSNTIQLIVNASVAPTLSPRGTITTCANNFTTLNAQQGYYAYQWYRNGIIIPGATTASYSPTLSGTYAVTGILNQGGCSSVINDSVVLNYLPVPSSPVITSTNNKTLLCNNDTILLTSNYTSGNIWYRNGILFSTNLANSLKVTDSGTYTAVVNLSSCISSSSNNIRITKDSFNSISSAVNNASTSICNGNSVALTNNGTSNFTWLLNNSPIALANNKQFTATTQGNYTCVSTFTNGCSDTSNVVTVSFKPTRTPVIQSLTGGTVICSGKSVRLSVDSTLSSYQWYYNGSLITQSGNLFYVLANLQGAYTVATTDTNGCPAQSSAFNMLVQTTPASPVITDNNAGGVICRNGNVTLQRINSQAGTSLQWYSNDVAISGATNNTYITNSPATYYATSTLNGCTSAKSNSINLSSGPMATFKTNTKIQELCNNKFVFTDISTGNIVSRLWRLQDGTTYTDSTITQVFNTTGKKAVTLIITGASPSACIDSTTDSVQVINCTFKNFTEASTLQLYPNPNNGNFKIKFLSSINRSVQIMITEAGTGRNLYSTWFNAIQGYNIADVQFTPNGLANTSYILSVIGNGIKYEALPFTFIH